MAFSVHRILSRYNVAGFNRRMRKTARPVVWEGAGAQSQAPDPIIGRDGRRTKFFTLLEISLFSKHLYMRHSQDITKSKGDSSA